MEHFADRLLEVVRAKGTPLCVGLDPVYERLPEELKEADDVLSATTSMAVFCVKVLGAVEPHVACVKVQSACFERYGHYGVHVYRTVIEQARQAGLIVIGDAKRGDIGPSAEHYAAGGLTDMPEDHDAADAVTVSSYFGADGLEPFLATAASHGRGVFALVRTSNPGGDAIQSLKLADGRTVAEAVGQLVAEAGREPRHMGSSGYSLLGAVVGATRPADAARLRRIMPEQLFLVPGFGAQGGGAEGVRTCFNDDGTGAVVTASRSIIYAYEEAGGGEWLKAVERATLEAKAQLADILR